MDEKKCNAPKHSDAINITLSTITVSKINITLIIITKQQISILE